LTESKKNIGRDGHNEIRVYNSVIALYVLRFRVQFLALDIPWSQP
jgi:hypothetical protein